MRAKYAINLDAIYQHVSGDEVPGLQTPDYAPGWHLIEDFTDCGASNFVPDVEFNEDAFDLVEYPVDLLDDQLRMDDYAVRIGIEEIAQCSLMHREAMGLIDDDMQALHTALRACGVSEDWVNDFDPDHLADSGLLGLPLWRQVQITLEIYSDHVGVAINEEAK